MVRCLNFVSLVICPLLLGTISASGAVVQRPNVLLLCVDDLRAELSCMGVEGIKTPNIDRLAAEGRLFHQHYVPIAACGPSRCSLLTGRRVNTAWDVWQADRQLRAEPRQPVSLPHYFRQQGYRTVGIGKISHVPTGGTDMPFSWDLSLGPKDKWKTSGTAFFGYADGVGYNATGAYGVSRSVPRVPYEAADVDDHGYADAHNADLAIAQLEELAQRDQPFFLAVGFFRPHLPFNAPKKYWDMYNREKIPTASWAQPAKNSTSLPLHNNYEPTNHYLWPGKKWQVTATEGRLLKHGYWASVSYVDAQIGRVLDTYRRLGLAENTVVVLWSDHGWHLGEYGIWGKHTTYECSLRSPLIVRTPGIKRPGESTKSISETTDLYPTLVELCGLPTLPELKGTSLSAAIDDPEHIGKEGAIGYVAHRGVVGWSLRTPRYRLVEWSAKGEVKLVELFDHDTDPNETINISATNAALVQQLTAKLHELRMQ